MSKDTVMKPTVLVAQSGGPSPVINASLQGVLDACRDHGDTLGRVLAARHGVEGILQEELLDLSQEAPEELALLKQTPCAGAIGTCRYKLGAHQEQDFNRIVDVLCAHQVGYFFYLGGNDSMDTAHKVAALAHARGIALVVTGVPKTIDNDVGDPQFRLIDHTPGYGSAARYWAYQMQNANEENRGMATSECVSVYQVMGRRSGFLPAAARLGDPQREMPLQIYLPESHHTPASMAENVNAELRRSGRCIVVVSEGFDVGSLGERRDAFGHIEYGASETTVAQVVINYLNKVGLAARGQATGQVPGVLQRDVSLYASRVDLDEAYEVGRAAVAIALRDGGGWMATILRAPGAGYKAYYDKVPLEAVANSVRTVPAAWLSKDQFDVTDDFVRYAQPLIGDDPPLISYAHGLQRFARLRRVPVAKRLPAYVPECLR
jgi:6-phosphofructokinase 1